jgi:hypothetical protein
MIPPVKDQRDQPVLIPIDIEDYLYFWSPGLVTGCWVYAFYLAEGFHTVGTQAVNAIAGARMQGLCCMRGRWPAHGTFSRAANRKRRGHPLAH